MEMVARMVWMMEMVARTMEPEEAGGQITWVLEAWKAWKAGLGGVAAAEDENAFLDSFFGTAEENIFDVILFSALVCMLSYFHERPCGYYGRQQTSLRKWFMGFWYFGFVVKFVKFVECFVSGTVLPRLAGKACPVIGLALITIHVILGFEPWPTPPPRVNFEEPFLGRYRRKAAMQMFIFLGSYVLCVCWYF